jgi:hypothetical protein
MNRLLDFYSYLSASTGLDVAALRERKEITKTAMLVINNTEIVKNHQPMPISFVRWIVLRSDNPKSPRHATKIANTDKTPNIFKNCQSDP